MSLIPSTAQLTAFAKMVIPSEIKAGMSAAKGLEAFRYRVESQFNVFKGIRTSTWYNIWNDIKPYAQKQMLWEGNRGVKNLYIPFGRESKDLMSNRYLYPVEVIYRDPATGEKMTRHISVLTGERKRENDILKTAQDIWEANQKGYGAEALSFNTEPYIRSKI